MTAAEREMVREVVAALENTLGYVCTPSCWCDARKTLARAKALLAEPVNHLGGYDREGPCEGPCTACDEPAEPVASATEPDSECPNSCQPVELTVGVAVQWAHEMGARIGTLERERDAALARAEQLSAASGVRAAAYRDALAERDRLAALLDQSGQSAERNLSRLAAEVERLRGKLEIVNGSCTYWSEKADCLAAELATARQEEQRWAAEQARLGWDSMEQLADRIERGPAKE